MMGGGVPIFVETSSLVDVGGLILKPDDVITVDDDTPIAQRWAGWYVTGHSGSQVHLGNIQVHSAKELDDLDRVEDELTTPDPERPCATTSTGDA